MMFCGEKFLHLSLLPQSPFLFIQINLNPFTAKGGGVKLPPEHIFAYYSDMHSVTFPEYVFCTEWW